LAVDRVHLGPVLEPAPIVLPGFAGQPAYRRAYPLLVVGVGEEGTVGAAPLGSVPRDDPVAAAPEQAAPPGQQPREIDADHMLGVGRIDELDPLPGEVEG